MKNMSNCNIILASYDKSEKQIGEIESKMRQIVGYYIGKNFQDFNSFSNKRSHMMGGVGGP